MRHHLLQRSLPFTGRTWARTAVWTELTCIFMICFLCMYQRNCTATSGVFAGEHYITSHLFHSQITNVTCTHIDQIFLGAFYIKIAFRRFSPCPDSSLECFANLKWNAKFTKRWHSKNRSGYGENPRIIFILYIDQIFVRMLFHLCVFVV